MGDKSYILNQTDVNTLKRVIRKVDHTRQAGVTSTPHGISTYDGPADGFSNKRSSRPLKRFRIKTVNNDTLTCVTWDGTLEGAENIEVAKPWKLQHVLSNYGSITTISSVSSTEITVGDGTTSETWVVTPSYEVDDEIYADSNVSGGVYHATARYIDVNIDGRAWAVKA